ncbi:MAG: Rpn family recombination-promoting nuclease/putative transposase, partial [Planctomycetaceae bacterium]|nr:Rpn family recombination-promoting nuclease/putative transposase [Planctomycetaceae bacterium]
MFPAEQPNCDESIENQFAKTLVSHDIFFELVFQLKKVACAFMMFLLPLTLQKQLDIKELRISVRRFRDESFNESRADMVYEIPIKNSKDKHIKVYFVIEHKSYNDSHPMSQLFNYEKQIIDAEIELAKKEKRYTKDFKLPPIILIIFHHGEGIYTGSVELRDEFFQIEGLESSLLLNQRAIVFELSSMGKSDLPRDPDVPELYVALRVMQTILSKNFGSVILEEDLFAELKPHSNDPEVRKFAHFFLNYVLDSNRYLTD